MACIPRAADNFLRLWEYNFSSISTIPDEPVFDLTPGRADWARWTVEQLNPAQCRIAARHAREDINWQRVQTAFVGTLEVLVNIGSAAIVLLYAGLTAHLASEIFLSLLELASGSLFLQGAIITLIVVGGTYAISHAAAAVVWYFTFIWKYQMIPHWNRHAAYVQHLSDQETALMNKAEGRQV